MKIIPKNIILASVLAMVVMSTVGMTANVARADGNPSKNLPSDSKYIPLEPLPCVPGGTVTCSSADNSGGVDFQNYVQYILNLAIFLSAAAAVFMIVYGGFIYMTTESWTGKGDGLGKVKNAIVGLLLVLTSYLILRTIDPRLVAIPTTLVKPLNIDYKSGIDSSLTQTVNQTLTQAQIDSAYKNSLSTTINNINAENAAIKSIDAQKATVYDQINGLLTSQGGATMSNSSIDAYCGFKNVNGASDPNLDQLCNQLAQLNSTQSIPRGAVALNTGIAEMAAAVQQCSVGDANCFAHNNSSIQTIYDKYGPLTQPDQKAALTQVKNYSDSLLAINSQLSGSAGGWSPTQINTNLSAMTAAVNAYASLSTADPVIAASMKAQLQSTTLMVKNATPACTGASCK